MFLSSQYSDYFFSNQNTFLFPAIANMQAVWLSTVYCDTCGTSRGKGDKELKNIVDISTFHRDAYLENEDVVIYADKKHRYRHKPMADGGQISLEAK